MLEENINLCVFNDYSIKCLKLNIVNLTHGDFKIF